MSEATQIKSREFDTGNIVKRNGLMLPIEAPDVGVKMIGYRYVFT